LVILIVVVLLGNLFDVFDADFIIFCVIYLCELIDVVAVIVDVRFCYIFVICDVVLLCDGVILIIVVDFVYIFLNFVPIDFEFIVDICAL